MAEDDERIAATWDGYVWLESDNFLLELENVLLVEMILLAFLVLLPGDFYLAIRSLDLPPD